MEIDKQLLNDYFMGKEIYPNDIESIKKYREYCIEQANQPGLTLPYTDYSRNFDMMKKLYPEVSRKNLEGKKIIEIGTGANPLAKSFLDMGVTEYTGLEPFHPELSREHLKGTKNAKIVEKEKAINLFGFSGFKPLGDWMLQFVWKK